MTKRYVARSSQIAARALGGEMMIMSARDSTLFTLNEVAARCARSLTSSRALP